MARGRTDADINQSWQSVSRDWYSIYQWGPVSRVGYCELMAELIHKDFDNIVLNTRGVRKANFRLCDHRGQCRLNTGIDQHTEKRFVRAVFNGGALAGLGKVLGQTLVTVRLSLLGADR